jgi:uncharacterized protein
VPAPARAAEPEVPPLTGRVVDRAAIFDAASRARLEAELAEYEGRTGHQVVLHTTPSLEGWPIEDYSMRVAEAWRIGRRELDDGVIVTIAPNERAVRIEVGYGLEGALPDAIGARIVRDRMLPAFRAGDLRAGAIAGLRAVMSAAEGEGPGPSLPAPDLRARPPQWLVTLFWIALVVIVLSGRRRFFVPYLGGRRRMGGFGFPSGFPGGFGGRRGGFGGFGGGGGGFGGGGASGRW